MKNLTKISVIVLLVINLYLLWVICDQNGIIVSKVNSCIESDRKTEFIRKLLINNQIGDGQNLFRKNPSLRTKFTGLFGSDRFRLILVNSDLTCAACVDNAIGLLKECNKKIQINNVVLLSIRDTPRRAKSLINTHKIRIPFIWSKKLNLLGTKSNTPCFFVLSKDGTISNFFTPEKTMNNLTLQYFDVISKKYFSKNSIVQ